jgi:hypothetical protein
MAVEEMGKDLSLELQDGWQGTVPRAEWDSIDLYLRDAGWAGPSGRVNGTR